MRTTSVAEALQNFNPTHIMPGDPLIGGQINPLAIDDDAGDSAESIKPGSALCMSGGGYRAMVFHLGALIRLNEVGLLKPLARVSSVSGGSITAGVLGMNWTKLNFVNDSATNLSELVVEPIRNLARQTIDAESVIGGILNPFATIGGHIAEEYRKYLFGKKTLQDLPTDSEGPRFVINATNIQSGALWRFSRPYMGDYKVGRVLNPSFPLAEAVGASSAFPPILSPVKIDLGGYKFKKDESAPLQRSPFTDEAYLSDGGVYDNMGLQTAWRSLRTLFVSDAGAAFKPEEKPRSDWARHSIRVLDVIDNQVRSLRKIALIEALDAKILHDGAYWGISTDLHKYSPDFQLDCPRDRALELARTPTRLAKLDDRYQERLINWGYAITAATLALRYPGPVATTPKFPFKGGI